MKSVHDKIYDILDLLEKFTKGDVNNQDWQPMILDKFTEHLKLDRAALFVQASGDNKVELLSQNLLARHDDLYLEYYYDLDPFQFINANDGSRTLKPGPGHTKTVVTFGDIVDYHQLQQSEYYQRFMRPQKLAHDLIVYFMNSKKLLGVASLMRNQSSRAFSLEDVQFLKTAAPLIALALDNIDLKRQGDAQKAVITRLETQYPACDMASQKLLDASRIMQTFRLTRRESEIVDAVFHGRRNAEIAEQMFISEITVKKHLQNICAKLDVKNRTAIMNTILEEFGIL